MRPLLLDLFCCAGGAAKGYHDAGFDVIGVDIEPQPNYPYEFIQADALEFLAALPLWGFDGVHASPPCQGYSDTHRLHGKEWPTLIAPTRELMQRTGLPYVIENVMGAKAELRDPVMLCGGMFPGLRVYRHRLFETSFPLPQPEHPAHTARQAKMGRPPAEGEFIQIVGNWSGKAYGEEAMGMDWATRNEMSEAIPPAYAEYVGRHLMAAVTA